jgi:ABC-type transport system involved in cytochrome bd biosynthesis fused ATPase/permease subunit
VTGCGCLLLIAAIVGLIVLMIFGSTDAGEPVETAAALLLLVLLGQRSAFMPLRGLLVRARDA